MAFSDWSTVDSENGTSSGVNIAEGCPPSNVNNWGRRIMAQLRAAFNPILDAFFASTTLEQARTALGVSGGSTSNNNFAALTNAANGLPYMTGADAWAVATLTSFARTLLDDGDAATARATLGAMSVTVTGSSSSGALSFVSSGGTTVFMFQWADGTASGETNSAISYSTAFSSWSKAWCNGGNNSPGAEDNDPFVVSSSTTGATVYNAQITSRSVTVFAIGV